MKHQEMKLIVVIFTEINFISGDKISCKHYTKSADMDGNICICFYRKCPNLVRTKIRVKKIITQKKCALD